MYQWCEIGLGRVDVQVRRCSSDVDGVSNEKGAEAMTCTVGGSVGIVGQYSLGCSSGNF